MDPESDPHVTPGGSHVIKHADFGKRSPTLGFTESAANLIQQRETVYHAMFGDSESVFHELVPFVPHIDIYVHKPGYDGRDFYTLASGGMSDLRMTLPEEADETWWHRVELIFYTHEAKKEYLEMLRVLAHFPHDYKTCLGWGHTIPWGPLFSGSSFTAVLFVSSIVSPDSKLGERLIVNADPVNFLWVVPLTAPELEYKLQKGTDALLELFDEVHHPFIFDENRESYV